MILAMHCGFVWRIRDSQYKKIKSMRSVKILGDFCISTIAYYFIGYPLGAWHQFS